MRRTLMTLSPSFDEGNHLWRRSIVCPDVFISFIPTCRLIAGFFHSTATPLSRCTRTPNRHPIAGHYCRDLTFLSWVAGESQLAARSHRFPLPRCVACVLAGYIIIIMIHLILLYRHNIVCYVRVPSEFHRRQMFCFRVDGAAIVRTRRENATMCW